MGRGSRKPHDMGGTAALEGRFEAAPSLRTAGHALALSSLSMPGPVRLDTVVMVTSTSFEYRQDIRPPGHQPGAHTTGRIREE